MKIYNPLLPFDVGSRVWILPALDRLATIIGITANESYAVVPDDTRKIEVHKALMLRLFIPEVVV